MTRKHSPAPHRTAILTPPVWEHPLSDPAAHPAPVPEGGHIPRGGLALALAAATLGAFGLAWLVAARMGADAFALRKVLEATAVGIPATFLPVVLRIKRDYWAFSVVAAGLTRMLLCLGYCYIVRQAAPEVLSRPLFIGVGSGATLLLAVEVAASLKILSEFERGRQGRSPTPDPATRKPA